MPAFFEKPSGTYDAGLFESKDNLELDVLEELPRFLPNLKAEPEKRKNQQGTVRSKWETETNA